MSRLGNPEQPTGTELDVLRSFGWAIVELESVLFERYTHQSAKHSFTTLEDFRRTLHGMEAKGYLVSVNLHGNRAYKKSIVDRRILSEVSPKSPNDEMRLALASLKAKRSDGLVHPTKVTTSLRSATDDSKTDLFTSGQVEELSSQGRVTSELISRSQITGDEILQQLERTLIRRSKSGKITPSAVAIHIHNMRKALSISDTALVKYLEQELPDLVVPLNRILAARGSDYLLLSLRLVDSRIRKYM